MSKPKSRTPPARPTPAGVKEFHTTGYAPAAAPTAPSGAKSDTESLLAAGIPAGSAGTSPIAASSATGALLQEQAPEPKTHYFGEPGAAPVPAAQGIAALSSFVASLSPQQKTLFAALIATPIEPPKPVKLVKHQLVATRLGFDGITRRHPGDHFEMDINVNDEWPGWAVRAEDYVAPPEEPASGNRQPGVRGSVSGRSVI